MEGAILTLAPISLLTGLGMLWVFQRFSNQAGIRRAKNRLGAHLMELRLFVDEPALVWRAQRDLIAANVRYIGLMLQPALILTIPLGLLLVAMEPYYGRMPLFL